MSVTRKNIRVCEVKYLTAYYDVLIAVDTLDEVDNILQEWAFNKWGVVLSLPEALIYNKDISEVLTSVDTDEFVYVTSTVPVYMDIPRYAGITGTPPTLPTSLTAGLYVMPACSALLYAAAGFTGHFGQYTIPSVGLALTEGLNYIGIRYNSGVPAYIKYDNALTFDYSSIIPVATVLSLSGVIYPIPFGNAGDGLSEKLLQRLLKPEIDGTFTLATDTNYVELSALTVKKGMSEIDCLVMDTSVASNDMFEYSRDSNQAWQKAAVTKINNTEYQSASGKASLAGGEYVINYIYRLIHGTSKLLFNVLSNKFATLAAAKESEMLTDLPDVVTESSVLVGRVIVVQGSTSTVVQKVQNVTWGTVA